MFRLIAALSAFAMFTTPALAQCGGGFSQFVQGLKTEAVQQGHASATVDRFFAGVRKDPKVIQADRAQGVFQLDFTSFARRLISQNRINAGVANGRKYDAVFDRIERDYGINRGVLLAFWAFETD